MSSKGGVIVVVSGKDDTGELFHAIDNHFAELQAKAKETSESLGSIGESLKHGLQGAGIAISIQQIISGMKGAVTSAAEFGEAIEKAQIKTGIAAGTLSVMHYAAATTGTDFEQLVKGASRMGKNMADAAEGNKKLDAAFKSIGVNAKDVVGRTDGIDIAFKSLGKTLAATESPALRNQLLISLLGKSGMDSAPAILQLAENFDSLKKATQDAGMYMDKMSADELKELNAKTHDLEQRVMGAKVAFAEGLSPALTGIFTAFAHATNGTNLWNEAGKNVGIAALGLAGAIQQVSSALRGLGDDWVIFNNATKNATMIPLISSPWNKDERDQQAKIKADRNKEITDAKKDHDDTLAEEKRFNGSMLNLQNQIEHGTAPKSLLRDDDVPPGGGYRGGAAGGADKKSRDARELAAAQQPLDNSRRQLADAVAKSDEERAKLQANSLLEINDEMHKRGLIEETDYLAQKVALQNTAFDTERTSLEAQQSAAMDQMDALAAKTPKIAKERLETETRLNALQRENLALDEKVLELDKRRAKSARDMAEAAKVANDAINAKIELPDNIDMSPFKTKAPKVVLDLTDSKIEGEAEKYAHGLFDPLFNLGEKWSTQWKQIQANMLRNVGQSAESQLFGALFGDPEGRGGKGWDGESFEGDTSRPGHRTGISGTKGLVGDGLASLEGLFHKKTELVSNGTGSVGAGSLLNAAAGMMQVGKKGGSGGTQVIIQNTGAPMEVGNTEISGGDGGEAQVIQILLKQIDTNGPVLQGIKSAINL